MPTQDTTTDQIPRLITEYHDVPVKLDSDGRMAIVLPSGTYVVKIPPELLPQISILRMGE